VGRCLAISEELGPAAAFAVADGSVVEYLRTERAAVLGSAKGVAGHGVVVLDRAAAADPEELIALKRDGGRVALIDDPGPARAVADLVVDPPTGAAWPAAAGRRLGGFEHALIRREIRKAATDRRAGVEVLVSMGGSDPTAATPEIVAALTQAGIAAKAVLGPGYRGPALDPALGVPPAQWPAALAGTGLLVTRFGHTLLEAAHLGVPAIAVPIDTRDRADARAFAAHGTARALDSGSVAAIVELVRELLADEHGRAEMTLTGRRLVDGLGARRVAGALLELAR
jgi:UDP:flavonoid glycosyltransferase YjiC (YdhE family)